MHTQMLSNHRLSRILRESINKVMNEDVNTASPSPRIAKIYDKVQQASMQLHGKSLIDKSSTWQAPFTVEYDVKYTNRGYLKVTRVETEETVYNNSGSAYNANKSVNTWLITDKNYKEKLKDDYTGEGLYDMLKYDLKCAKAYEREYATLGESVINRAVRESVKRALNEKWYPEEEDDISDYSYGMIAKLSTRDGNLELDQDAIARLESVKDESIETGDSYVSVMVRNVEVSCDQYGVCDVTIECAVSAPDMPMSDIEEETESQLWYWFEEKTNKRLIGGFDWIDEKEVFDRRGKNR